MRTKLILAFLLMLAVNAFAQTRTVTGVVLSQGEEEPLIGATVKVKGTRIAAATDVDGRFTLKGLSLSDKQLEVSYVGYQPVTVDIKPEMKIYLTPTNDMLDEMIVVAFGKQKRESFTGAASVVNAEQIERAQVNNPVEALNGLVTGMSMTEPNSLTDDPKITIRGISSINASSDPLIVLDGMPYSGYMTDINAADIASMTVLKDAASNALYGARGANGVILITTKSAQRGKTKVTLNAKWGANTDGRIKYETINDPGQYYEAFYSAWKNYFQYDRNQIPGVAHLNANNKIGAPYTSGGLGYVVYAVPQNEVLIGDNGRLNPNAVLGNRVAYNGNIYTLYPDNWLDAGLRNGFRQEYNATVTTGNDRYTMFASLGYLDNEGLSKGSDLERISARMKADAQLYPFLKLGVSSSYNHTVTNSQNAVFSCLTNMAPIYPLYLRDESGRIMTDSRGKMFDYGDGLVNGLLRPTQTSGNDIQEDLINFSKNVSNAFNIQGYATVDFLDGFHFTLNGSTYITENRISYGYNPWYGYSQNYGGALSVYHYRTNDFNTQQLLNYSKEFNGHSVDVLLGHEYTRWGQTSLSGSKNRPVLYTTNQELTSAIETSSTSSSVSNYNIEGWFMRAQYDYRSKYFGSASIRRDGSSRFAKGHRWGTFWSIGAAWILSKEDWFPKDSWVDMLKLKASYGEQGNDAIGSFRYTNTYTISNVNGEGAFIIDDKGNPDITWETVGSVNVGAEFELFNGRLSGGLEFYNRITRDMLTTVSTPMSYGFLSYYDNVGNMSNTGLELSLNGDIISSRPVTWNVGLNLSWERNRVTSLPEDKKLYDQEGYKGYISGNIFYGEGLPMRSWRLKKYAGVNDEGRALFYQRLSDGTLTTTTDWEEGSYFLCGSALPNVFGSITTSLKFYGVDINAQFNYSIGGKKYDTVYSQLMTPPSGELTGLPFHKDVLNGWTPDNSGSDIPMFRYDDDSSTYSSDRFLTNASYFSFKNISVGYTFPKKLVNKAYIANLRVYCQMDNIYYWSKRTGFDPRQSTLYGSYNSDSGYAFPMRTISGGLQVEF